MTGLLLLQSLAQMIDSLGGKGLEWSVMIEAFVLMVPALVVLTLPMGILTASLYGFSQLASDLEITAMYANGISVWRMARPALAGALVVTLANFLLFDQFVPLSNMRLRGLQAAVSNKNPTLAIRAGELNRVGLYSPYILRTDAVDSGGMLRGVTIYSLGGIDGRRITRADSGLMQAAPNGNDILLTLYQGNSMSFQSRRGNQPAGRVEYTTFGSDRVTLRDVTNTLQRSGTADRGDREQTSCQLLDGIAEQQWYLNDGSRFRYTLTQRDLRRLAGLPPVQEPAIRPRPPLEKRCGIWRGFEGWLQRQFLSPEAIQAEINDSINRALIYQQQIRDREESEARRRETFSAGQTSLQPDSSGIPDETMPPDSPPVISPPPVDSLRPDSLQLADSLRSADRTLTDPVLRDSLIKPDSIRKDSGQIAALNASNRPPAQGSITDRAIEQQLGTGQAPNDPILALLPRDSLRPIEQQDLGFRPIFQGPNDITTTTIELEAARQEVKGAESTRAAYRVEFHKKYAIPLSSFCFVLLGLTLALKFPRGGIGLVIGGSLITFMIFYVMIQSGESLAKRQFLSPVIAMYGPLVIFTAMGLLGVASANRELGSTRGGDGIIGRIRDSLIAILAKRKRKEA